MILRIIKLVVLAIVTTACCTTPFSVPECFPNDSLYFNILSSTGENLFIGTDPKYIIDELQLYTIYKNKRYNVEYIVNDEDGLRTVLDHRFDSVVIEIQGQSRDTINFELNVTIYKCCGRETEIDLVEIDGVKKEYNPFEGVDIIIKD